MDENNIFNGIEQNEDDLWGNDNLSGLCEKLEEYKLIKVQKDLEIESLKKNNVVYGEQNQELTKKSQILESELQKLNNELRDTVKEFGGFNKDSELYGSIQAKFLELKNCMDDSNQLCATINNLEQEIHIIDRNAARARKEIVEKKRFNEQNESWIPRTYVQMEMISGAEKDYVADRANKIHQECDKIEMKISALENQKFANLEVFEDIKDSLQPLQKKERLFQGILEKKMESSLDKLKEIHDKQNIQEKVLKTQRSIARLLNQSTNYQKILKKVKSRQGKDDQMVSKLNTQITEKWENGCAARLAFYEIAGTMDAVVALKKYKSRQAIARSMIAKNNNDLEHFKFSLARAMKRNNQIKKILEPLRKVWPTLERESNRASEIKSNHQTDCDNSTQRHNDSTELVAELKEELKQLNHTVKTLGSKSNSANKKSVQVYAKIKETIVKYEQFKTILKRLEETLQDMKPCQERVEKLEEVITKFEDVILPKVKDETKFIKDEIKPREKEVETMKKKLEKVESGWNDILNMQEKATEVEQELSNIILEVETLLEMATREKRDKIKEDFQTKYQDLQDVLGSRQIQIRKTFIEISTIEKNIEFYDALHRVCAGDMAANELHDMIDKEKTVLAAQFEHLKSKK